MNAAPLRPPMLNTGELPKQNIRDQVYALLRDRMHRGEITYQDRLVDHELAGVMKVSRMPVREALLQLKNEGYLEGTSRGFVLPQFTPEDIANVFEIRLLLEPAAAADACGRATLDGLGKMKIAAESAERAHRKADVLGYMQANWSFRAAWIGMVPNRRLVQMIDRLHDHAQAVRLATLKDKAFRSLSLLHTQHILDAFLKQDAEAVRERVTHNLRVAATSYYARQEALLQSGADDENTPLAAQPASRKRARTR